MFPGFSKIDKKESKLEFNDRSPSLPPSFVKSFHQCDLIKVLVQLETNVEKLKIPILKSY